MTTGYNNARLVDMYRSEVDHTYKVRASLESKATTHMQIIGIIMGLYGTIFSIFFISRETLDISRISVIFVLYIINTVITAFFIIVSLIVSILVFRVQSWNRPNYNDLVMGKNMQINQKQVKKTLEEGDVNLIDSRIIAALATVLRMNRDNNIKIAALVTRSHKIIIAGLFSFLASLVFLIIIGIQINI